MKTSAAALWACTLFLGFAGNSLAQAPATNPDTSPLPADNPAARHAKDAQILAARVRELVRQLSNEDPRHIEGVELALASQPPAAFALMEEALKDPALAQTVAKRLQALIDRERPRVEARRRIIKHGLEGSEWEHALNLASYEKFGNRNAKWDAFARETIRLYSYTESEAKRQRRRMAQEAILAGCDDPFVMQIEAQLLSTAGPEVAESAQHLFDRAADGMLASKYPHFYKVRCCWLCFEYLQKLEFAKAGVGNQISQQGNARLTSLLNSALDNFGACVEEGVPESFAMDLGYKVIAMRKGVPEGRNEIYDRIYKPLEAKYHDDSELLTLTGKFYVDYAWDARGGDWGVNVTPQGWKLFAERLDLAEAALTKAWEKDPTNHDAPDAMLNVELGQGKSRQRMELWFTRAMAANPDDYQACVRKLLYLEPKWHGSEEEMLKFAMECMQTKNWRGELPFIIEVAVDNLVPYMKDAATVYGSADVWRLLESLYEPYLLTFPKNNYVRSKYALRACKAGKWDIARRQFDLLGDAGDARIFGSKVEMTRLRDEATEKGAAPAQP